MTHRPQSDVSTVLEAARALGGVVVESAMGWMVAIPRAPHAAQDLLPEGEAARTAGVSLRVLRDARRAGELPMLGRQRSRVVRRADLERWIGSRLEPVAVGNVSAIERRAERIGRASGRG